MKAPLLVPTEKGLYVPLGDFYIDPVKPVPRAVITHAHSDHARRGSQAYLCSGPTGPLLRSRLGRVSIQTLPWGEKITIGEVQVSLHPAGHILGSAQIRIEHRGYVFVVTGDYKSAPDPTAEPWEAISAHAVLSECTFGLPLYRWPNPNKVITEITTWWAACQAHKRIAILLAYSLGKAQRLLASLPDIGPRYVHPSIAKMTEAYEAQGIRLGSWRPLPPSGTIEPGALLLLPPQIDPQRLSAFAPYEIGEASGWLLLRKHRRQPHLHQAFVLSDHADFDQLVECLKATGAETFYFTHGYREAMQSYFAAKGYESYIWPDGRPSTSTLFPPESSLEPYRPPGGPPLDHPRSQPPLPSPT
jgi:putative mRNA 3-end processing factor